MADGSGKPRYENMETRRVRIETQINMATPGKNMFTAPVLLTENYIPGASLHGRKPAEMKKADLLFWLRCRGDSCKGMTVKAQLVKRYVCIQFVMFYKKRLNPLFFSLVNKSFEPKFNILRLKSRRCTKGCCDILANYNPNISK